MRQAPKSIRRKRHLLGQKFSIIFAMSLLQRAIRHCAPRLLYNTPCRNLAYRTAAMSTISSAITKDHRELKQYYDEVINNPNNHDHQQRYGNQFTWELARHSVGEELIVYPALEKYLGDRGKQLADHDRQEHHEVSCYQLMKENRC